MLCIIITFLTYVYLTHHRTLCLDTFFIYAPQILHNVHFIPSLISTLFSSCFLSPDYWVWAGSLRYFPRQNQIRALHFCLFTVWLASISVWPWVNKIKPKEVHQLHFPLWFHFYFVCHKLLKSKFTSSSPGKRSQTTRLELRLAVHYPIKIHSIWLTWKIRLLISNPCSLN